MNHLATPFLTLPLAPLGPSPTPRASGRGGPSLKGLVSEGLPPLAHDRVAQRADAGDLDFDRVAVLSNLVVDLFYAWLDPRIRLA